MAVASRLRPTERQVHLGPMVGRVCAGARPQASTPWRCDSADDRMGRQPSLPMLRTLDEIVQRLVADYQPDRVILFGAQTQRDGHTGRDIDLLIVKESDLPLTERHAQVERLLADRGVAIDLTVYTPSELLQLYRVGNPFVQEVVETGKVVYMRKATLAWLREAEDERDMATILFASEKLRGACLHSQQSVEKGLKALIIEKGERPSRAHDILELLNRVKALGWSVKLGIDDAVLLNAVYRGRYPTEEGLLPHGDPTEEEARRATTAAQSFATELRAALEEKSG